LDREDFDLAVVVPAGATKEQFRIMFQNFVADRFHLEPHMESRKFLVRTQFGLLAANAMQYPDDNEVAILI
jgi:uncharacterized protein (TIGR03435 family)